MAKRTARARVPVTVFTNQVPQPPEEANIARMAGKYWAELARSPGTRPLRISIPAGQAKQFASHGDRHSIRIFNTSATESLQYGESEAAANDAAKFQTLPPRTSHIFEIHYMGLERLENGDFRQIFHCEWDNDMWIHNPNAGAVIAESFEVY